MSLGAAVVARPDGLIYVIGGEHPLQHRSSVATTTTLTYDPEANRWRRASDTLLSTDFAAGGDRFGRADLSHRR